MLSSLMHIHLNLSVRLRHTNGGTEKIRRIYQFLNNIFHFLIFFKKYSIFESMVSNAFFQFFDMTEPIREISLIGQFTLIIMVN